MPHPDHCLPSPTFFACGSFPFPGLRALWDHSELPPSPKRARLTTVEHPATGEDSTDCQRSTTTEVMADGSAPQLAPSFSPPAPEAAGSLTLTSTTLQVPATNANVDSLSSRPLIPPVPHKAMGSTTTGLLPTSAATLAGCHLPVSTPSHTMPLAEAQTLASALPPTLTLMQWTQHQPQAYL